MDAAGQAMAILGINPASGPRFGQGVTVRRGQGCTLRVNAVPAVHRQLLDRCRPLGNAAAIPAQGKARRAYANRVGSLGQ